MTSSRTVPPAGASSGVGRRDVLAAAVGGAGLLAGCAPSGRSGQVDRRAEAATFVLVHGAWHGGWCWRDVRAQLEASGHAVHTPTLTGLGEREHLMHPDIALSTHIMDVVNVIRFEDLTDIVLVGHSYGGMVITGVADQLRERIEHVIYLDAAVPQDGQSMLTQGPERPAEAMAEAETQLRALAPDGIAMMPLAPAVFGVPPENASATEWLAAKLTPHPLRTWFDPIRLQNGGATGLSRTYVHCVGPVLEPSSFPYHAARAQADPDWSYVELETGHDAMVTAPVNVSNLLLSVWAA